MASTTSRTAAAASPVVRSSSRSDAGLDLSAGPMALCQDRQADPQWESHRCASPQ